MCSLVSHYYDKQNQLYVYQIILQTGTDPLIEWSELGSERLERLLCSDATKKSAERRQTTAGSVREMTQSCLFQTLNLNIRDVLNTPLSFGI